jgi:hypothetical protein
MSFCQPLTLSAEISNWSLPHLAQLFNFEESGWVWWGWLSRGALLCLQERRCRLTF